MTKQRLAKRAIGLLFFVAPLLFSAGSGAQENACVTCHQKLSPSTGRAHNFSDWEKSIHAQKGVTCNDCHGGDPKEQDPLKVHQGILKPHQPKSPLYYTQIPETCGKCHAAELEEFRKSAHYQELKKSERGPNCVTCHGSMAIGIPQPSQLEQTCSLCHRERNMAREALVTLNLAGSALKKWQQTFAELKKRGGTTPAQEASLKEQEKAMAEVQKKWHAFAMQWVLEEAQKISAAAKDGIQVLQPAKEGK